MSAPAPASILDLSADALDGTPRDLAAYRGKVMLIVNTASACGFTPQYQGLEELYQRFKDRGPGLVVLGFPCNQFGKQESGTASEIGAFCEKNYGVSFPLFAKVDVNGSASHPLFTALKTQAPGLLGSRRIKGNFTKFLVRPDGTVLRRYAPFTKPAAIAADIAELLGQRAT